MLPFASLWNNLSTFQVSSLYVKRFKSYNLDHFFLFDHDGKSTFWEDQENNLFPLEGKTIPAILQ